MKKDQMGVFADTIMKQKYSKVKRNGKKEEWHEIANRVSRHVLNSVNADAKLIKKVARLIKERKFIPAGRYLYASGRPYHQTQNCLLLRADDSREGWSELMYKASMALMSGAGIGIDYSDIRAEGKPIRKTGGTATGPIALMQMINEAGRGIMQGGSRRCLPYDTKVTMADNTVKNINSICVGDKVQTRFGPKKVTNVFDQGMQNIVEIKLEDGNVVKSSMNHKWLSTTASRQKTFHVPTHRLSVSDKLYKHMVPTQKIDSGEFLDTDVAYLIGYYLGDGCAYVSGRTAEVTLQVAHPKYNKKQVNFLISAIKKFTGNENNISIRKGHGEVTEIRLRRKKEVAVFQQFKSPNKPFTIPKIIKKANLEAKFAFLAGWFDADGYYGKDSWKLANHHSSVRLEVMKFLLDLGFIATESGDEVRLCSYQFPQWKECVIKYAFKRPRGRKFTRTTSEIPISICSIRKIGAQHTYDIEVEEVHEFIADGFVSHNSAIWAGLNWKHADIHTFIHIKNWPKELRDLKAKDFNFPLALDGTNISVLLDDEFFEAYHNEKHALHSHASGVYWAAIRQMLKTAEPGFSIDVGDNSGETLRNACTEVSSKDDSDICNLGSINMARITSLKEMKEVVELSTAFLLAGTVYSDVPFPKVDLTRTKNRRLGLGLMGLHEWLLAKGKIYAPDDELREYLEVYATSDSFAKKYSNLWDLSIPVKTRAIAPTGSIGILAETTTGIEPIFCVAYKRRYLKHTTWHYQYVIDPTAKRLIDSGINPENIEDAYVLSQDIERRVGFQVWVQKFVDHSISSTINLPSWGSEFNSSETSMAFGNMILKYLPELRGLTVYPDGSRSGQPLVPVKYSTAIKHTGQELVEEATDLCEITKGGSCGE